MRTREIILSELKTAVTEERLTALRILHLLREVEEHRIFLEMGFPSIFDFATKELGYSAGAAHRRIQSMRLLKAFPEFENKIEDGSLSLCVAAKTQGFFRKEDRKRQEEGTAKMTVPFKAEIVQSMLGASNRECEAKLAAISPESAIPPEKERPVAAGKTLIQFIADDELLEKFEKLKGLLAHQNFEGRYDRMFEILADMALKKLEPEAQPKGENPAVQNEPGIPPLEKHRSAPTSASSRYIPAAIKRAVRLRDNGCCTFMDKKTGRLCGSRYALQLDHIHPYAWGGKTSESNLRLRCFRHNAYTAQKQGLFSSASFAGRGPKKPSTFSTVDSPLTTLGSPPGF